jgi:hypothetical protein
MRSYLILSAINGLLLLLMMMMLLGLLRTAVGLTAAVVTAAACEPSATCRGEEPTATCRGEGGARRKGIGLLLDAWHVFGELDLEGNVKEGFRCK